MTSATLKNELKTAYLLESQSYVLKLAYHKLKEKKTEMVGKTKDIERLRSEKETAYKTAIKPQPDSPDKSVEYVTVIFWVCLLAFIGISGFIKFSHWFKHGDFFRNIWNSLFWIACIFIPGVIILFSLFGKFCKSVYFLLTADGDYLAEKRKIYISNQRITDSYEREKRQENTLLSQYRSQIRKLDNQMNYVSQLQDVTLLTLKSHYARGVIHPKYQNLIAISSLYEFIDIGMCTALEGPQQAYYTYEQMKMLDKIITSLEAINNRLDDIRDNQGRLYTAIRSSDDHAKKMVDELQNIANRIPSASEIAFQTSSEVMRSIGTINQCGGRYGNLR